MHYDWGLPLFFFFLAFLLLPLQAWLRNDWRSKYPEVTSRRLRTASRLLYIWGIAWLMVTSLILIYVAWVISDRGRSVAALWEAWHLTGDARDGMEIALIITVMWLPALLLGKILNEVGNQIATGESPVQLKWLNAVRLFGWLLLGTAVIVSVPAGLLPYLMIPSLILMSVYVMPLLRGTMNVRRNERQQRLLFLLTAAVEHQRPLPEEITAFAQSAGSREAQRLREVAGLLRSGISLPDAFTRVPELLPAETVEAIRVATASRSLEVALRQGALREDARLQWRFQSQLARLQAMSLIAAKLVIAFTCLMFLMYWIVPKLKSIFDGYGVKVPRSTTLFIQLTDFFAHNFLELFSLLLIATGLYVVMPRRLTKRLMKLSLFRSRVDSARIMDQLALLADAGIPWTRGIAAMAGNPVMSSVRKKLAAVQVETQQGGSVWESMFRNRLITRPERELLQAAERVGNLPWTLRLISDRIDNRRQVQSARLGIFVQLVGLLIAGVFVGWVCVAIFEPLTIMIS